jgi:hypothetical protein
MPFKSTGAGSVAGVGAVGVSVGAAGVGGGLVSEEGGDLSASVTDGAATASAASLVSFDSLLSFLSEEAEPLAFSVESEPATAGVSELDAVFAPLDLSTPPVAIDEPVEDELFATT